MQHYTTFSHRSYYQEEVEVNVCLHAILYRNACVLICLHALFMFTIVKSKQTTDNACGAQAMLKGEATHSLHIMCLQSLFG